MVLSHDYVSYQNWVNVAVIYFFQYVTFPVNSLDS